MSTEQVPDWSQLANSVTIPDKAFIDGRCVPAQSGAVIPCVYPGDGRVVANVAACDTADVDAAVYAARRSFDAGEWSRCAPAQRKKALLRLSELILTHRNELAVLETLNVGKPITSSSTGDIPSAANCFAWYAEAIDKVYGEVASTASDMTAMVIREPVGVVAAVVPWNYPLSMSAWKLAPALATGNSVILKPAEQSPFTALRLAQLALEAGVPSGVLNVVTGPGETAGRALGLHMDVDCVGFTGSTEVGRYFMQYSGQSNIKRIGLELGGKSPQVVLADCTDLDAAATAIAGGIFANSGQVCNAGSRLIVDESVKAALLAKVLERARALKPGDPMNPTTRMGSLVTSEHMRRVLRYITQGVDAGAKLLVGGEQVMANSGGYFVGPTIFDEVSNDMSIAREEIFGPVLSIITVRGTEEAIRVANDTIYGLAAGVWTNDVKTALRAAKSIRAGVVWVNCFDRGLMSVPFGGFKQSGFGRDKSIHAMDKYTDLKAIWLAH